MALESPVGYFSLVDYSQASSGDIEVFKNPSNTAASNALIPALHILPG